MKTINFRLAFSFILLITCTPKIFTMGLTDVDVDAFDQVGHTPLHSLAVGFRLPPNNHVKIESDEQKRKKEAKELYDLTKEVSDLVSKGASWDIPCAGGKFKRLKFAEIIAVQQEEIQNKEVVHTEDKSLARRKDYLNALHLIAEAEATARQQLIHNTLIIDCRMPADLARVVKSYYEQAQFKHTRAEIEECIKIVEANNRSDSPTIMHYRSLNLDHESSDPFQCKGRNSPVQTALVPRDW